MITIEKGHAVYSRLLMSGGNEQARYVPSRFFLREDTADGTLACNTLTGELALLTAEEAAFMKQGPLAYRPEMEKLIQSRFLVPEDSAERRTVDELRALQLRRRAAKRIITQYNILPTTCCNARCFYCYESDLRQIHMTEETAEQLAVHIADHCGGERVKLLWFGGEPTLGRARIDQICRRLDELGVGYASEMTSNAYLFDRDMIRHAKACWNLQSIQITLDGTEQVYIRTKDYQGITDNPYRRVLRNIEGFLEEQIRVQIRLNMDLHNAEDLSRLADELAERFGTNPYLVVYVRRINAGVGFSPIAHGAAEEEELQRRLNCLQDRLERCGWRQIPERGLPHLKVTVCMADDPQALQCTPDGILSKCEDQPYGHPVGTLTDGITDEAQVRWWQERTDRGGCGECALYPCCIRLLKHCPGKQGKCPPDDRDRWIAQYRANMLECYATWKRSREREEAGQS